MAFLHSTKQQKLDITPLQILVLLGILFSAFNLRTAVTSITPLLELLSHIFHFGSGMKGVIGMLPTAAFAVTAMITPLLIRHYNLERTILIAMCLAGVGLIFRAFSINIPTLIIGSIIALAGMGIGNVVLPPLVKRYFPQHIGKVSTLYITILQIGTMLPALLAVSLTERFNWRFSLGIWSVVALVAVVIWFVFLKKNAVSHHNNKTTIIPETPVIQGKIWRSPTSWGMAFMFGMTSLITYSIFTWLPKLITEAGGTQQFAGGMVALFSALGLVSSLLMPMLANKIKNPFPLVLGSMSCYLVSFAGLYLTPMGYPFIWVIFLGLGSSTFPLALTLINLRTKTPEGSAALSGFTQALGYSLSCIGPIIFGLLHDYTSGWKFPLLFLSSCVIVLCIGGFLACRPRYVEDSW